MAGYLTGSDQTYGKNFRVTRRTFDVLLKHLQVGGYLLDNGNKFTPHAKRQTGRFKLAVVLYFFGQGTGYKAAGDCASLGESAVAKYVEEFIDGTFAALRPIYMPRTPPSPSKLAAIRSEFSRRGAACRTSRWPPMAPTSSSVPPTPRQRSTTATISRAA